MAALNPTQSAPSLDDCFGLVRALYEAGYGVEVMLVREPEDLISVCIPLPTMSHPSAEELTHYPIWERLTALASEHGVEPKIVRDFPRVQIEFHEVAT